MSLSKIQKKIAALDPSITVTEERGCIVLRGEVEDWATVVKAGSLAVDKKHYYGVVNDIRLKGFQETVQVPKIRDHKLDGDKPDILIIGAGITGCSIARELSRWNLDILVVDRYSDVAEGATKANGGVVHAGVNFGKHSQKHYYNARGNAMYQQLSEELHFPLEQKGQVMLDVDKWERLIVKYLAWNAKKNLDMPNVRYLTLPELHKIEPHVPDFFDGGMFLPIAGVTSPYGVCIAMAENAVQNGARFSLETMVEGMSVEEGKITSVQTNRGTLYPKVVCNAAGIYADKIAEMAGDRTFTIHPRRGTDIITDAKAGYLVNTSMAKAPFAVMPNEKPEVKGKPWKYVQKVLWALGSHNHTKGVGLIHSVYGNMLVGPNATETPERENTETRAEEFLAIMEMQRKLCPELKYEDVIAYFTGVRATLYEEDFCVRKGLFTENIMEAAGIQSPGITAAPAIGQDIAAWCVEYLKESGQAVHQNTGFHPERKPIPCLKNLTPEERDQLIRQNPDYGIIVCRCEEVSKGEILDALNSGLCVPSVDGIKRRLRPGMGRCQGGFCSPLVMQIIAEHQGIPISEVRKDTEDSVILYGKTK